MTALRRHRRLLRTALLVLLVLGIAISPTLAAVGEMHSAAHAAAAAEPEVHAHSHSAESGHHHEHPGDDRDPDHATGGHGLMHQACGVSISLPEAMPGIAMPSASGPRLPEFGPFQLPGDSPDLPFRPPIA